MHTTLLLLQMIGPPVPAALRPAPPTLPCPPAANGEVVVCGRPKGDDPHRVRPLPDTAQADPLRFRLPGGGTLAPATGAPGWGSTRVMATVRIPF